MTILEYEPKDITLSRMYFQIRFIFSDLFQFQRIVRREDGHRLALNHVSSGIYRAFVEVNGFEPVLMERALHLPHLLAPIARVVLELLKACDGMRARLDADGLERLVAKVLRELKRGTK